MNFPPVSTMADLITLDELQVIEGYQSAENGDPEPGPNRGRAFWHGWCNRMRDIGALPPTPESENLAKEFLEAQRMQRSLTEERT